MLCFSHSPLASARKLGKIQGFKVKLILHEIFLPILRKGLSLGVGKVNLCVFFKTIVDRLLLALRGKKVCMYMIKNHCG